jgi:hypothetical protein
MTVKKQQKEQEELRATRSIIIRALGILAAVAALAVAAAPVGSAAPPRDTAARFELSIDGHSMLHGTGGDGEKFVRRGAAKAPRPAGTGIIAILIGAKAAGQPSPPRLSTRSGGEVSSESSAKVPPPKSVKDGSSNTVMFGE